MTILDWLQSITLAKALSQPQPFTVPQVVMGGQIYGWINVVGGQKGQPGQLLPLMHVMVGGWTSAELGLTRFVSLSVTVEGVTCTACTAFALQCFGSQLQAPYCKGRDAPTQLCASSANI
mgnify:FL=1